MQSDWLTSALSPIVYGDIALSINTHYITTNCSLNGVLVVNRFCIRSYDGFESN